ncbi:hypothetical protein ES707_17094 [subsurface metagenome]
MLILAGVVFVITGLVLMYADKIPLLGKLPGDINISGKGWGFHFPIVTCIIISVILTIIINIIFRR